MRNGWFALLLLLPLVGACHDSGGKSGGGRLEARWVGTDTGKMSAPGTGEWCEGQRRLEVRAIQGDTGLALAIFPAVILSPDTYPVLPRTARDSAVPSARVALRLFGPTSIQGFQGDSGSVVLERTDSGMLSGGVTARVSSVSTTGRLTLTGEFRNLAVVEQRRGCLPEPGLDTAEQQPESSDSDVVD